MIVYADVLFLTNFVINAGLLYATALLSKSDRSTGRVVTGAALGAVYALLMFFPNLQFF